MQSLKSDRVATFGCFDMKLAQKIQRKEDRAEGTKKIRQKEKAYMDNFEKTFSHSDTPDSDCDEEIVTTSDVSLVRESSGKKEEWYTCICSKQHLAI